MTAWLSPQFEQIPELLRQHPRWFLWTIDGSGRKTPRNPSKPDKNIDAGKASNWTAFSTAQDKAQKHNQGVGFALGHVQDGPTFSGVDLDKCRNPETGTIEPWALRLVQFLNSYTEVSPSGTGLKIFVLGSLPDDARQGKVYKLEMYDRGRYFTVTGHHLEGTSETVEPREEQLRQLHANAWSGDLTKLVRIFGFYISEVPEWINIHCPWTSHHSGGNQERDAGLHRTDGKIDGFNCFHAGCHEKTLADVRALFGLKGGHTSDFITDHDGKIMAREQENIRRAIAMLGAKLEHDVFDNKMYLVTAEGRRPLNDSALDRLYLTIESTYRFSPPSEYFLMVTMDHARANPVHPVLDYLKQLKWDGTKRLDTWLIDYGGAENTELHRVIGAKTLIATVRRVRKPGSKFDEMLVLESEQGQFKSSAILALCPIENWFSDDLPLNVDAKQIIERTLGKWIIEASDLSGMRKGEVEHLKAMMSRCVDGPVRLAYQRIPEERPRSFIMLGTTNSAAYLKDSTGNRRFWPVKVKPFKLEELRRDRDQLWAEAVMREETGESIRLDPKYYKEMGHAQEERRIVDPWEEILRDSDLDWEAGKLPVDAVWALLGVSHHDPRNGERLHQIMQKLGYPTKRRCRHNGRFAHHWLRKDIAEAFGEKFELEPQEGRPEFIKREES